MKVVINAYVITSRRVASKDNNRDYVISNVVDLDTGATINLLSGDILPTGQIVITSDVSTSRKSPSWMSIVQHGADGKDADAKKK